MEKTIAKHLCEKDGHAVPRQLGNVHTRLAQRIDLADGQAVHALHHDHFLGAVVPNHLGDQDQIQARHVAAQLRGIRGFAHQIKLVMQVLVKFGHHLARLEAFAI